MNARSTLSTPLCRTRDSNTGRRNESRQGQTGSKAGRCVSLYGRIGSHIDGLDTKHRRPALRISIADFNEAGLFAARLKGGQRHRTMQSPSSETRWGKRRMASRNLRDKNYSSRARDRRRFRPKVGLGLNAIRQMLDVSNDGSAQESLGSDRLTLVIPTPLNEVERAMILSTLEKTGGNKTQAAQLLKITKKTLYNKLHTYEASRHSSP